MEQEQQQSLKYYWGNTPEEQDYYKLNNITSTSSFFKSPRNLSLYSKQWLPLSPPRGIICMVHGYGNDISWTFQSTAIFLARNGYACFALDMEGHGRSEGLKAYVPNVNDVVNDYVTYFNTVIEINDNLLDLPKFLFGESMGGAICLLIASVKKEFFTGAILIAPMVKISDKVRPRWPIPEILMFVSKFAPTLAIVPTEDLVVKSVKVPEKRIIGAMNPNRYRGKPRLGTVMELLRVTDYLSSRLSEVSIPFIVLHGDADSVTDCNVSKELYECAKSEDKSLKIYEGMMHSLLFGETDENVEIVRGDILAWLSDRC
ncbi:Alpha/beta hydrolase fold-1 [Artemisia annua]|uniref:Alpha/beta hydrolase fold-1 n=1 Tax=Artemisia annua TaxID=35608 RepID=A0A2U1QIG6_ARTAN|nr:Alpha/beta hydrolase fold-1 [Artemisia annua]